LLRRRLDLALVSSGLILTFAMGMNFPLAANSDDTVTEGYGFETQENFDNTFDLTVSGTTNSSHVVRESTGGLGPDLGSGSVVISTGNQYAILGSKTKYTMKDAPIGSEYTFTSFVKNEGINGWSGMGFSGTPSAASTVNAPKGLGGIYRPSDALGVSVAGTAFVFHVGPIDYAGYWNAPGFNDASVEDSVGVIAEQRSSCLQPVDATRTEARSSLCASASQWYKVTISLMVKADNKFDMRLELYTSDAEGVASADATAIFKLDDVENTAIRNSDLLSSYVNFSGHRFTRLDDYALTLKNGASFVELGAPVVTTTGASVSGQVADLTGKVTIENGTPVVERGFVLSENSAPTLSDNKLTAASGGVGVFSVTTSSLEPDTYFVRSYATNGTGTSYGAQLSVQVVSSGSPVVDQNPGSPAAILSSPRPPDPSDVKLSSNGEDLRVTLEPSAPSNVVEYSIRLRPAGGSCLIVSPLRSCDIAGVKRGTEYSISVMAVNELGSSKPSVVYNRVVLGSSGWLTFSKRASLENFAGNSPKVTRQIRTKARAFARNNSQFEYVTCTGFAAGNVASERQFDLALKRAKRICNQLKKVNPELETSVFSRVPGSAFTGANRRVLVTGYTPID
jgi:hypothetical protein